MNLLYMLLNLLFFFIFGSGTLDYVILGKTE